MFHAAAMYISLFMTHYWDVPAAYGIGDRPLSADIVIQSLKHSGADSVILPPAILEELSQSEEDVEVLKNLAFVAFGGGEQALFSSELMMKHY